VWCPLEINNLKHYQFVMRQCFEMAYYGHYSQRDIENMPVFERRYLHTMLAVTKKEEHDQAKRNRR